MSSDGVQIRGPSIVEFRVKGVSCDDCEEAVGRST